MVKLVAQAGGSSAVETAVETLRSSTFAKLSQGRSQGVARRYTLGDAGEGRDGDNAATPDPSTEPHAPDPKPQIPSPKQVGDDKLLLFGGRTSTQIPNSKPQPVTPKPNSNHKFVVEAGSGEAVHARGRGGGPGRGHISFQCIWIPIRP